MLRLGDALWIAPRSSDETAHVYVVISDPDKDAENVVLVPFTSWESWKDPSCKLEVGDHPFINHTTCIDYRNAELLSISQIEARITDGSVKKRESVAQEVLEKIWRGASMSRFLPGRHDKILADQGLIS